MGCLVALAAGWLYGHPASVTAQGQCQVDYCFEVGVGEDPVANEGRAACSFSRDATYMRQHSWMAGTVQHIYIDTNYYLYDSATGEAWIRSYASCTDGTSHPYWRSITPDPRVLVDPAYDEAVGMLFDPVAEFSPVHRGIVNLGMWLAVAAPRENPVTARAEAGGVWAEVTATLTGTTFDMGNGDVVACGGFGTPIPESEKDDPGESPTCGYTYADNADAPYTITITSTWEFTWALSSGASGVLPGVGLSSTFDYDVWEVQTVGTRG